VAAYQNRIRLALKHYEAANAPARKRQRCCRTCSKVFDLVGDEGFCCHECYRLYMDNLNHLATEAWRRKSQEKEATDAR